MKKIILILMIAVLATQANAQTKTFTKTYGGAGADIAYDIIEVKGGYLVSGASTSHDSSGITNAFLMKINTEGDSVWSKSYNTSGASQAFRVISLPDGNFVMAGIINTSANNLNFWLMKVDSAGDFIWQKNYGSSMADYCYGLETTPDGGFILAGNTYAKGSNNADCYAIKVDQNGAKLWEKTYGGDYFDEFISIRSCRSGGYIMSGGSYSFGPDIGNTDDLYLVRIAENGDIVWEKNYGGSHYDWANDAIETPDGNFVAVGLKDNTNLNPVDGDVYLLKVDTAGKEVWSKSFALGPLRDEGQGIGLCPDGGFLLTGFSYDYSSGMNANFLKVDSDGKIVWNDTYDYTSGQTFERAFRGITDSKGNYIFCGFANYSPTTNQQMFIASYSNQPSSIEETDISTATLHEAYIASKKLILPITTDYTKLTVIDLSGREVQPSVIKNNASLEIDFSPYPAGVYILSLSNPKMRRTIKVLVAD